eukprot:CAMPEP_0178532688 /NCGR_PEP_ID=MMETSP0696-20121128/34099_1 /TAXON_ID=265572 /ORGANISM="Extubocellulus spinifer, Strain CCMP396" /LENGTH=137 /DNA_ID=CAMNT_0020164685 /DNA_START=440 /DNA_END=853 /DNA_ORIENTATION=-
MSVCVGTGTSNPLASIPAINVMILSLVIVMEYQFCRAVYILQLLGGAFGRWVQPCMQGWGLFWWIEVVALILWRVPPLLWPILVCYGVLRRVPPLLCLFLSAMVLTVGALVGALLPIYVPGVWYDMGYRNSPVVAVW